MTEQAPCALPAPPPQAKPLDRPISWSSLRHYEKSPAHWLHAQRHPPEQTPAMLVGSAFHCMVLEPPEYWERHVVAPELDRRTRAGKEAHAKFMEEQAQGKYVLTREQHEQVTNMELAVRNHRVARALIDLCGHEVRLDWTDDETGLQCTARLDAVHADGEPRLALDLKTCQDASPRAFARTAANSLYHGQAAFYMDALAAVGTPVDAFAFVAVEKEPPHAVAIHVCDAEMIEAGRKLYRRLLDLHAECLMNGRWPGYENTSTISLPGWAL